jgi:CheY-like chemotaxis protein
MSARIYVVEDEGITAIGLRKLLIDWGYDVPNFAFSGIEACKKIEGINPDLVLMDIMVKGEFDGIDAVEYIKKHYDVPIIFITAYNSKDLIERAKKVGYEYYVIKPYEEEDLHQKIENVLSKYGINSFKDDTKKEDTVLNENPEEVYVEESKNASENVLKTDIKINSSIVENGIEKNEESTINSSLNINDSELIENGKNLSKNFKNDKNAVIILDNNGYLKYMDINSSYFIGCGEESAISKNLDDLVKSANGDKVSDILVKEPLNKEIVIMNQIILVLNNENINVKYRSLPVKTNNGNFAGVCVVFEKIISSKKLEEKEEIDDTIEDLKEYDNNEIDFREVYLKLPIPVIIFNSDGLIMYFNKAALNMFELLNIGELEDLNIFEEFEFEEEEINYFFEGKDIIHMFNPVLNGYKSIIECQLRLNHLLDNNALIMAVFQKKSVKKLKNDNNEFYKNLVENNTNALCAFSPEGTIKYANETFYSQFDIESGEYNYFSIFPKLLRIKIKMSIRMLKMENNVINVKNLTKMYDNYLKLWKWVYKGIFDESEELIEIIASGYPITVDGDYDEMDLSSYESEDEQESSNNRVIKRIS